MAKSFEQLSAIVPNDLAGIGDAMEGYMYARWPSLYLYHLRRLFQMLVPDPDVRLVYPENEAPAEIDEMIQMTVSRVGPSLLSVETSPYHGKVVKLGEAKMIVTINRDITLTNLDKVVPYKHARDIILKNPDQIAVINCPCRLTKEDACKPFDVCMVVGDPFAGFILEHGTNGARKISQDEAVAILNAEDERGHIHSAWFKQALGDRFYAICNCCKCCCGAMRGHFFNTPMFASSGYVSEINEDCTGCGLCEPYCQFGAISMSANGRAVVDFEKCMGCGVCESKCPEHVISMRREPLKGEPLDIVEMVKKAEATTGI